MGNSPIGSYPFTLTHLGTRRAHDRIDAGSCGQKWSKGEIPSPTFFPSVHPGSHGHPEHHRQGVHHTLIQLCSGIFGHGHGVDGDLQLRRKQGVKTLFSSRSLRRWFAVETSTYLW